MNTTNPLIKLIKGDIPLVTTFWIFNVLVNIIIIISAIVILSLVDNITTATAARIAIISGIPLILAIVIWCLIMFVAVWNSATKYTGRKVWMILAKASVVIGIIVNGPELVISLETVSQLAKVVMAFV